MFDLIQVPPARYELHYGSRNVCCFVDRPEGVDAKLAAAVGRRPNGVALICGERSLADRDLDRLVGQRAAGLAARGVGDRIGLMLDNSIEFPALLFAVAHTVGNTGSAPDRRVASVGHAASGGA